MIGLMASFINIFYIPREMNLKYCDIKGNVKNPGVYLIDEGDVINDIIIKAGGLKNQSYTRNINFSKKVEDEMVIKILSMDEYEYLTYVCPACECEPVTCNKQEVKSDEEVTTSNITTTLVTTKETITTSEQSDFLIDINIASLEELIKIPGIGGVLAGNIIEYRSSSPFLKKEDLLNVKGIGEKLYEKIKDYIKV